MTSSSLPATSPKSLRRQKEQARAQAERIRAKADTKTESLHRQKEQARGQWIEQQEAAFVQEMLAAQQVESHRGQDQKMERMETKTSLAKLETHLKAHFRRPSNKQPPSNAVIIPPMTAEQYTAVKNWNTAAQVGAVILTEGTGVIIGAIIGFKVGGLAGSIVGGVIGAMLGAGWGAYEAICIASVQDEFDAAYQQGGSVTVWRDGWKFNVDANSSDGMYTQANAPLSALYVAVTTLLLTGKMP
ncbi:MAG: hypothetical protein WHV44_15530 [Anaerolineales bacterium]